MTDVVVTPVTSGYNINRINSNFSALADAVNEEVIHSVGGNNTMSQDLDFNSHNLLNIGTLDADTLTINGRPVTESEFVLGPNTVGTTELQDGAVTADKIDPTFSEGFVKTVDLTTNTSGNGSDLISYIDTLVNTYAKSLSQIVDSKSVSVLRCINPAKWEDIRNGVDTTDWSTQINALLTAMSAVGHSELYFPAGVYSVGSAIIVPSNMTITGVRGKTWLKPIYDPAGGVLLLSINAVSNVKIEGMGFDGNMANLSAANFANVVTTYQSSDVLFLNCNWKNCKGISAIFSTNIARSGLRGCRLDNCGTYHLTSGDNDDRRQGVAFSNGTQANNIFNFVEDTTLTNIGLDCISIGNQTGFSACRNKINRNYAGSIYDSGSVYTTVSDNHIINSGGNAIDVNGADYGVYSCNNIFNSGAAGIMLAGELTCASVIGNIIRTAMQSSDTLHKGAITLDGVNGSLNHVVISGNVCEGNLGWGFYVRPGYEPLGSIRLDQSTNHFANNSLGDVSGLGSGYFGANGGRARTLAAGASLSLLPALSNGAANFAMIDVIRANDSRYGSFVARGSAAVQELLDPNNVFDTTDTGTSTAIFYDATSGYILIKNRSASSQTLYINVKGVGAT